MTPAYPAVAAGAALEGLLEVDEPPDADEPPDDPPEPDGMGLPAAGVDPAIPGVVPIGAVMEAAGIEGLADEEIAEDTDEAPDRAEETAELAPAVAYMQSASMLL